jgi:hypothetical protein
LGRAVFQGPVQEFHHHQQLSAEYGQPRRHRHRRPEGRITPHGSPMSSTAYRFDPTVLTTTPTIPKGVFTQPVWILSRGPNNQGEAVLLQQH